MSFIHNLKAGDTISNGQLTYLFKSSTLCGMRRFHKTNTLVIVSNHTKEIYEGLGKVKPSNTLTWGWWEIKASILLKTRP
jgi:hypothetical protein